MAIRHILLVEDGMYQAAAPKEFQANISRAINDLLENRLAMIGYSDVRLLNERLDHGCVDSVVFFSKSLMEVAGQVAKRGLRVLVLTERPDLVIPQPGVTVANKNILWFTPGHFSACLGM